MKKVTILSVIPVIVCLAFIFSLSFISTSNEQSKKESIIIGSKNITENIVLAHMMADLIEDRTDLIVKRMVNLGGSSLVWKALLNNTIQLYPEYTGTVIVNFYNKEPLNSEENMQLLNELIKPASLTFLGNFGFNNAYTLAVTEETAKKYRIKTISDLARVSHELVLGSDFEFIDRADGYIGLSQKYNLSFKKISTMNQGVIFRSLLCNKVDVVLTSVTDGQLKINRLINLEDDKGYFPRYDAGSIVRQDVLKAYPNLENALNQLNGQISEEEMQKMNFKVEYEGLKTSVVAREFLKEKGFIK